MLMTGIANHLVSPLERNFNRNFTFDSKLVGLRWHFILVEPSVVHLHEGTLAHIHIPALFLAVDLATGRCTDGEKSKNELQASYAPDNLTI